MQGDNKKLNIPFIEKEIKNLFDNALPDFIERMKKLESENKDIKQVIQDDDAHDDGSNMLRVLLEFENDKYDTRSVYNDLYRKHQLLGNGAEIGYKKLKFPKEIEDTTRRLKEEETFPFVKKIMDEPVRAPTTTIPIEKEDIKRIISMLYNLTTYEYITSNRNNLSQKEIEERTVSIFGMINKLLGLL